MRILFLSIWLTVGVVFAVAQKNTFTNNQSMETIRLIYPQWQGGIVTHWMPDIPADDASRGYYLGAQLLNMLAPQTSQKVVEVPITLEIGERKVEKGISDYAVIFEQTKAALAKLRENNPKRVVTLGGECSVSVVPFTYLANKYPGDVAIVWIDAHPDINLPYDEYKGYHAMALTACLGQGDEELMNLLPSRVDAFKALIVGLRAWEKEGGTKERQEKLGIKSLSPGEVADNSQAILAWLKGTGASKVVIHFDLDVLDPAEIIAGVGVEPGGLKLEEAIRIINDVASAYDLVGLTIAEPMPRIAIKLKNMLERLPLLNDE